jgi:hypothetical protein
MLADRLPRHHKTRTELRQRLTVALSQHVEQEAATPIAERFEHRVGLTVIVIAHSRCRHHSTIRSHRAACQTPTTLGAKCPPGSRTLVEKNGFSGQLAEGCPVVEIGGAVDVYEAITL